VFSQNFNGRFQHNRSSTTGAWAEGELVVDINCIKVCPVQCMDVRLVQPDLPVYHETPPGPEASSPHECKSFIANNTHNVCSIYICRSLVVLGFGLACVCPPS
jgi:hypothetical protein